MLVSQEVIDAASLPLSLLPSLPPSLRTKNLLHGRLALLVGEGVGIGGEGHADLRGREGGRERGREGGFDELKPKEKCTSGQMNGATSHTGTHATPQHT